MVAFQDSKCFYDLVDQAELEYDATGKATIVVHPSGKNEIRMILENYLIIQIIETERTTACKENTKVKETNVKYIYIALGVVIIILLVAILYLVIKRMKDKRNTEMTVENNENYGRPDDFEQYYEEEKNAKIVDTNDYYN